MTICELNISVIGNIATGFVHNIPGYVQSITGFVPYFNEYVLNVSASVLNFILRYLLELLRGNVTWVE